jgi:type II secretory pathway pseudopilin PulG
MKREQGFSVVEVLVSTTITLLLVVGILDVLKDAFSLNEKANQMSDLGQNLRAGINFMVQDLMQAGWQIPTGGIAIPSGVGAVAVNRPSPPRQNYTFAGALEIAAINPGAGLGPVGDGRATDMVNILYADYTLPLNQTPLDFIAANGSTMTVNAGTPITGVPYPITVGDLIYFNNSYGTTMQYVTGVNGQVVHFDPGDPMNLNQPGATAGNIIQLQIPLSGGVFPPTTATRVWLVTYYLDYTTDPTTPRLIRQVNNRPGQVVGLVLEDLQLSYDLVDSVTNPTYVKTPVAPNSPNQIRKVNIYVCGRSDTLIRNTKDYLRQSLTTQVSLRCLAFVNRYK